eukprot:scaffold9899_cov122-Isochrysis_galbana.AAC.5
MLIDVPPPGGWYRSVTPGGVTGSRRRRLLQVIPLIAALGLLLALSVYGPMADTLALAADAVARSIGAHRHRHRVKQEWKDLWVESELHNSTSYVAADHAAIVPDNHPPAQQQKPKSGFELNESDSWSLGCTKNFADCGRQ